LKGNIDPFGVLHKGTPEQVEAEVKACVEAGAPGGGFILGTQDSTLGDTPIENLHALVAAGRKYGRYNSDGSLKPAE
jgi:uroporphyrinogen decarboxylase